MTEAAPESSSEPHIVVQGLGKRFGSFDALADISATIGRGEVVVILGGSGAGKSTLLKLLIGLDKPTSGSILVNGVDIVPLKERAMIQVRKKFGMVFQYSALLDSMNVRENVAFPLREHTRLREREIRARVKEKLELLELIGVEERFPSQLSGGMRKRVGLARALMLEPEVLMYDEPTSGLDPLTARLVDRLIVETRDRFGVTSIVISHDMAGALRIADQVHILHKGRLAVSGTPDELVHGDYPLAREFFSSSGIDAAALLQARRRSESEKREAYQA
jgi:phospholipid/cholesterol/gamma-HCH transport system ATP-binding protein